MSIQIDCEVDLSPAPLNVTLLPPGGIDVAWPPPGTVNARLVPSPSIDVSTSPASPIDVTLLPSSSFDVALYSASQIEVNYGHQGIQGPPGPQGPAGITKSIWGETPVGAINGTNLNYASANPYSPGLLSVYLNGLRLRRAADYNETSSQSFQFLSAPLPGDSLSIDYIQP